MVKKTEILAPAGDLKIGIQAFKAGADAVYLGLKKFSARKSAANFDWDDLRIIKQYANDHQKKVYVAINTLIKQDEISQVMDALAFLDFLSIDAIIVQDLGLLNLSQSYFPQLTVHASTQMAINSIAGLLFAEKMGIKRVVLPRETTLTQIQQLRSQCPQMGLEIFIHGSLCYSFSGLCLASGLLTDRSANRGDCVQICRNYFTNDQGHLYPFSCNDLLLGENILSLQSLGVESFKIEGRLKDAAYVIAAVKLYRYILDTEPGDTDRLQELTNGSQHTFARSATSGYFFHPRGSQLVNPDYSKSLGQYLGIIQNIQGKKVVLDPPASLKIGDQLLALKPGFNTQAIKLSVIKPSPQGFEAFISGTLQPGDKLYLWKRASSPTLPVANPGLRWKKKIQVTVKKDDKGLHFTTTLGQQRITQHYPVTLLTRTGTGNLLDSLNKALLSTGKSWTYGLVTQIDPGLINLFIPPAQLKKMARDFWPQVDQAFAQLIHTKAGSHLSSPSPTLPPASANNDFYACRQQLSPPNSAAGIPFAHPQDLNSIGNLSCLGGCVYIPIHPFLSDDNYYRLLSNLIHGYPDHIFVLGLNNPAHVYWLAQQQFTTVRYWIDYSLYIANLSSWDLINRMLPNYICEGVYHWLEQVSPGWGGSIQDRSQLPLFISLGCVKKNLPSQSNPCSTCTGSFLMPLKHNQKKFVLQAQDCINYFFDRTSFNHR